MNLNNDAIARRLTKMRHVLGLGKRGGKQKLAAQLAVTKERYSRWEGGGIQLPLVAAVQLMQMPRLRGLTLDWIYLGIEARLTVELADLLREAPDRDGDAADRDEDLRSDKRSAAKAAPAASRKAGSRKPKT